jgi:tetratricopeptide (TPR) repeat protein
MSTLRDSVLDALAASHDLEAPLVVACDDSPAPAPDVWTARDHLAHIAHYRDRGAALLDAVRAGTTPPAHDERDLDERNAGIYAENRDRPAAEVTSWASASAERLAQAVQQCSDDQLRTPRPGDSEPPVWWFVSGCGWGHVAQHLVYWSLERGDQAAAELVAGRVYEIDRASFDDPEYLGAATYNAGCLYAIAGRPDEALALVNQALTEDPSRREWAREDPDLVSIRHLLA